ncbi:hydrogenase, Fe-only [Marvinbryantia formatexigens DSM 14469]|uniref:Hydrogenase, Fe-only n=1 Tax=Marvinbryantia formatexigens DSM 14469 TaxID=478749 RepID=C6LCG0_9FIRM|nr:[FeFe] hydrogenase, group A [Marvinbryantia formatexigens]EET61624.1 hydrogenase, Fe-only [Marvinbryantia formatexigens DSM 14469]UWO24550.1 [FeFe] hydrogenase, group A [Marvinbryantia formatexigens DSM 14469]SDF12818.1 NADH-quinone oxidoreductase subunit G [Marvinbryantia formatexigens]
MGTMTIDGRKVTFTDEKNVLSVIRNAGIDIPTLCYHSELSTFGACRLCTVEDDRGKTFASCSEEPRDGMVIFTNTGKLRKYRKLIIELLLAAHCRDCLTCEKSGDCNLQTLAKRFGVMEVRFENYKERRPLDFSSPSIVRDPNKCILCGNCVRVCEELQGIGALGFAHRGSDAMVMPAFDREIATTDCVNCGQCRIFCPTGAISIRHNRGEVWEALSDPDTRVVAQVAPAVRVAVGDAFGLPKGRSVMGKIVNVLHRMGFDEVYDTTFGADLTIMEESAEFLERVQSGEKLPLLTSCCPAWVKFVGEHYPEFEENVSTCRSPQGMLSAVVKEYFRDPANSGGKKTVMVSIMPCTAKKMEANRPNSYTKGEKDTDFVLTTTELIDMIKTTGIDFAELEPESSDIPFGFGSGGGVIFGVTGGVTEAVIRRLAPDHAKETFQEIAECGVRQEGFIREFSIPYNGTEIRICVVSGLANARTVMEQVKSGEKEYHLIEIMACRRGCIMGGGQPRLAGKRTKAARTAGIYRADSVSVIKKCDENPMVASLYEGFLKGKEHELLHNHSFCAK